MRNLLFSMFAAVVLSVPGAAQGPTISATQSALGRCSYDTCALRLDRAIFGGRKIVLGLDAISSPFGLIAGSVGVVAGVVQATYAERHFSRAVWLYNRELPH